MLFIKQWDLQQYVNTSIYRKGNFFLSYTFNSSTFQGDIDYFNDKKRELVSLRLSRSFGQLNSAKGLMTFIETLSTVKLNASKGQLDLLISVKHVQIALSS